MRIRVAHISLQFSDSDKQHTQDIEKIFDRAQDRRYAWIMGTEAGPGADNSGKELLRVGKKTGYKMVVPSQKAGPGHYADTWIGVREDLVTGGWKPGFERVIPSSGELYEAQGLSRDLQPRWGPKGPVTVKFDSTSELGEINLAAAHYLTQARDPKHAVVHGVNHWEWNEKLADVIGEWAIKNGKGRALAFYSGDQNMMDNKNDQPQGDTFMGGPLTSMADELKAWQNTGHGPIDVIASYDADGRVEAKNFVVLDDREFHLHTDHFLCEGIYSVKPLKN